MSLYKFNQERCGSDLTLPQAQLLFLRSNSLDSPLQNFQESIVDRKTVCGSDPIRPCPYITQTPVCQDGKWSCPTQQALSASLNSENGIHSAQFIPQYTYHAQQN